MINRLLSMIRLLILKIKYLKSLKIHGRLYKCFFGSLDNIGIIKGKMIINDYVCIRKGSRFGINNNGKITIGSCTVNSNTVIASLGEIIIGNEVSIGPNVCIYDHDHSFDENGKIQRKFKTGKVVIGNNVWIGAGCIILRDTIIGDNTVIGAGTIVKGNIPNNSLVTSDRGLIIKKLEPKKKND